MSIIRKLELALIGLLLAAVVVLGLYAKHLSLTKAAAQENYQEASGDVAAATVHSNKSVALVREEVHAQDRMEEALEVNRDWADAPVPDDVAALLCHRCDATGEVP